MSTDELNAECAVLKRLSAVADAGARSALTREPAGASNASTSSASTSESSASTAAPNGEAPREQTATPQRWPENESEGAQEGASKQTPPQPNESRQLVARYYARFHWSIAPGVLVRDGKAGFALAGNVEYGFDTGSVIAMPGVSLQGFFLNPNVYVGMPTFKLVLPLGSFAPFIDAGAGLGQVTQPSQTALALMGGGGFWVHTGPFFALGLEAGYEALLGTDFRAVIFNPLFAFNF